MEPKAENIRHVQSIADDISDPSRLELNSEGEECSAFDYLEGALDIEYTVNSKGEYLGARILVAFGGPNIWIDTRYRTVDLQWWGESATATFDDNLGLDDACRELWGCR